MYPQVENFEVVGIEIVVDGEDVPDCAYVENLTPAEIRSTIIYNAPGSEMDDEVVKEVRNQSLNTMSSPDCKLS